MYIFASSSGAATVPARVLMAEIN